LFGFFSDPIVHMTEPKGFRFIQAFVHMMKYHAHTHHLLDIITKVRGLFVMTTYTPVHHVVRLSYTTGATSGTGTAYPCGAPKLIYTKVFLVKPFNNLML
jgi:hypothetical protein